MKASVFVGTSLDGFIARPGGELDFLPAGGGEPHGYEAFFASVDAVVIGRKTYETVLTFDGWPYGGKPVFVLSTRAPAPAPDGVDIEGCRESPPGLHRGSKPVVSNTSTWMAASRSSASCAPASFNASRSRASRYSWVPESRSLVPCSTTSCSSTSQRIPTRAAWFRVNTKSSVVRESACCLPARASAPRAAIFMSPCRDQDIS